MLHDKLFGCYIIFTNNYQLWSLYMVFGLRYSIAACPKDHVPWYIHNVPTHFALYMVQLFSYGICHYKLSMLKLFCKERCVIKVCLTNYNYRYHMLRKCNNVLETIRFYFFYQDFQRLDENCLLSINPLLEEFEIPRKHSYTMFNIY